MRANKKLNVKVNIMQQNRSHRGRVCGGEAGREREREGEREKERERERESKRLMGFAGFERKLV